MSYRDHYDNDSDAIATWLTADSGVELLGYSYARYIVLTLGLRSMGFADQPWVLSPSDFAAAVDEYLTARVIRPRGAP